MPAFLLPLLQFFGGPLGKIAEYGLALGGVLLLGMFLLRQHDEAVIAKVQAAAQVEATKVQLQQAQLVNSEMDKVQQEIIARINASSETHRLINAAPITKQCVDSPAVHAALDGLRDTTAPGGSASTKGARQSFDLQAAAKLVGHSH